MLTDLPCVLPACLRACPQESTVVPLLMQGLQSLCRERPEDPVEYLANYLLQHNTKKGTAATQGQQQTAAGAAASESVQQQLAGSSRA